jgi:hypothetical protein
VKVWTAHTRESSAPVLVREGFSWAAFVFGPIWLLARRAWIPAALVWCAWIGAALLPDTIGLLVLAALHWLLGLAGQDMLRWSLGLRGFLLAHVIAATDEDAALARLLGRRPDLVERALA